MSTKTDTVSLKQRSSKAVAASLSLTVLIHPFLCLLSHSCFLCFAVWRSWQEDWRMHNDRQLPLHISKATHRQAQTHKDRLTQTWKHTLSMQIDTYEHACSHKHTREEQQQLNITYICIYINRHTYTTSHIQIHYIHVCTFARLP